MAENESKWVHLEVLSVTISGYFRTAAVAGFDHVPMISEQPAITLELVDEAGNREMTGIFFDDMLDDARHGAAKISADFGVPILDYTMSAARRAQQ